MEFLDHFFFKNTEDNVLNYKIKYPADQCCYRLVIFDESYGQWGGIRPHEDRLTCRGMINRVKDLDFKIKLSERDEVCQMETDDAGLNWLVCRGHITFESRQRPQSYFVHLTNCRSNRKGLHKVSFSLHMTNGKNGVMKEFAENQKFLLETDLAFFLAYAAVTILATRFGYVLIQKKMLHLTYRLFYSSLFFKTLCLSLLNIELSRFAGTGLELTPMQDTAEILSCLSSILFVSVLLLVSKGFSVTRAHPSLFGTVKMILFGLLYMAAYAVVFFDQRVLLDPQDIIASRTSLSASGLIAIKIGGCIIFVYGCFFTIKNHATKVLFYLPFTVFFSVWFLTEPTYRLLSINNYPVLRSPNIWNGIDLALCFAGHAYFLIITRPSHLNKRFPFHLPANKISVLDGDENFDTPYQPAKNFFSVFQTWKKPTGTDTFTLTIAPVLPFNNAGSDKCLALPRPPSPVVPAVLITDATTSSGSTSAVPTVSATVVDETRGSGDFQLTSSLTDLAADECRVPATRRARKPHPHHVAIPMPATQPTPTTEFVAMPRFMAQAPIKNKVATSSGPKALPMPTVAAPKGGFSIFTVKAQQDLSSSSKISDTDLLEQKQKAYEVSKVRLDSPLPPIKTIKGPGSAVQLAKTPENVPLEALGLVGKPLETKATKKSGSDLQMPSERQINGTVLFTVQPTEDPFETKAIKGPGFAVQQTKVPDKELSATYKPIDEPLKTKASGESGSDAQVPSERQTKGTVRLITVQPADDPFETKAIKGPGSAVQLTRIPDKELPVTYKPIDESLKTKASGESGSDAQVPGERQTTARLITVQPADDPFKTKAFKGPGSAVQLTKVSGEVLPVTCKPIDEPLKTKASGESGSDIQVPGKRQNTGTVCQITVQPANDPFKTNTIGTSGSAIQAYKSDALAKPPQGQNVRFIAVQPADDPFQTKTAGESRSALQASKSEFLTKPSDNVHLISVQPVDEPLQSEATGGYGSAGKPSQSMGVTDEAISSGSASYPVKTKDRASEPKDSALTTDLAKLPKVPQSLVNSLKMQLQVPAPKIQNWTAEPLIPQEIKHCKSSKELISAEPFKVQEPAPRPESSLIAGNCSSSQENNLTESLQNPGPRGPPTDQTIGPRSVDSDWLPAADGGDFPKPVKKTRKEPSCRRFPKPNPGLKIDTAPVDDPQKPVKKTRKEPSCRRFPKPNPGLKLDTTPVDDSQKAMDHKTRKKTLKHFLKLARKLKPAKNQPAKAD